MLQLAPAIIFLISHAAFITVGTVAVCQDFEIQNKRCGQETHIIMYSNINLVFAFIALISYFFIPPGECARARATWLMTFHFALLTWGMYLRIDVPDECHLILGDLYHAVNIFQMYCIVHNALCLLFLLLHEGWLGSKLGYDLTLIPEPHEGGDTKKDFTEHVDHFADTTEWDGNHQKMDWQNGSRISALPDSPIMNTTDK
jgi:hypothetical protein